MLLPPQRLILCGAGDDAQAMASTAASMGWRISVVDGRTQWATRARFPEAESVGCSLDDLLLNPSDAVAIMTHSYEQDRDFLERILPAAPRYLGLLGARHRSALLMAEAAASLQWPLERVCEAVNSPMGLDLGGDGADSVALATIAEIQASLHGKLPLTRRLSVAMVEEQIEKGGASRYLQTQCVL
ncbi:XdhC family protein [Granulicella cerasi]|uniref:XdhC family protein n=1 Tax=Granulicella cerasi TaxID=741063 RepID=A0ABW1Z6Z0_9BACT|nr:XdhC family protein [Granulicella cerasi]